MAARHSAGTLARERLSTSTQWGQCHSLLRVSSLPNHLHLHTPLTHLTAPACLPLQGCRRRRHALAALLPRDLLEHV